MSAPSKHRKLLSRYRHIFPENIKRLKDQKNTTYLVVDFAGFRQLRFATPTTFEPYPDSVDLSVKFGIEL